ncbi:vomeronasal 1 receptor ornAnaV1R3029 [Ornithorhynchus anatinus]|uniref:Vomeronasal type-1 receptor n=1 Tax=Ornithorhynchus anatinus TaxID=9258 RepID=A0A6I8MY89_ORNAN|nr:vomeronasal 1 receptor ornAnaV1R3029 [Ornithorhynchus anatinus]
MDATELSFAILILLQISIGLSANVFLLQFYARMVSASHRPSSSDLILAHLALANAIILLTSGIPETMSVWGLKNFLDAVGCKILIYLYRVARGLAICTTCLLSIFQAVTIGPGTSRWARIKAKLPKLIVPFRLLSWVLNMLIDVNVLIYITGPQNSSSVRIILDLKYCSTVSVSAGIALAVATAISLRDVLFVVLMSVASTYMVFVLHRHHRQVRHLHGTGHSPKAMPEVRAAKRVIALVTLYVLLYGRQSIMFSILLNMKEKSPLLVNSHMVLSFTFSAVSPFLMIHGDRRMRTFRKTESPVSNTDRTKGLGETPAFSPGPA